MRKIYSLVLTVVLLLTFNASFAYAISDATPPVIEEVKILTPVIKPGGKIKIQVKVSDDVSGTSYVSFQFYSPSRNANIRSFHYVGEYEELSNTYIFEITELSRYAENGNWTLDNIMTSDYAGNSRFMSNYSDPDFLKDLYFTVDSGAPDEDVDVNDGFTAWESKDNVELNKEFIITFNADIDIATILEKNIYVKDQSGNSVPLMFIIDRNTDLQSSLVTIAPVGSYRPGSTYTLYIKDIISKSGKVLNENVKMKFTTMK